MSTRIKIRIKPILRVLLIAFTTSMVAAISPVVVAQELGASKPPQDRDRSQQNGQGQGKSSESLTRAELKKRFEERFERITRWKGQGLLGETFDGWVEAPHDGLLSSEQRDVVAVENADRKALYALIADRVDEGEKRVPPRVVAERNARRNFEKAEPEHLLKVLEGYWITKRDLPRVEDITRTKKAGDIGETWEGFVGLVNQHASDDVKRLVEQENASRRDIYAGIAKRLEKISPEEVGRSIAKSTRDNLQPGQYYQTKTGDWEKRSAR
jgi:uncharacterized protein YdbL (DUF1318 family)